MRRPVLLTLAAVGGVVVLLGGTGIFAALSDTARSGTNSIDTDALPSSSDLRVASAELVGSTVSCASFSDDLASPLITITGPPGSDDGHSYFYCLHNAGSQTVTLAAQADEFTDVETGCTGDESNFDATCGSGTGELGDFVRVLHSQYDCATGAPVGTTEVALLRDTISTPVPLGTLGPSETHCFVTAVYQSSATEDQRQQAQSDRLTWRFAWIGQA